MVVVEVVVMVVVCSRMCQCVWHVWRVCVLACVFA